MLLIPKNADAIAIDWVTIGDPGNAADTDPLGYGAVAESFQIMKYEFTNRQYSEFLNAVARTDAFSLYNGDLRVGITRNGTSGSYVYAVKAGMSDKPVIFVSWFDAARVANWLTNGATETSSTESGAYTLVNGQVSGTAPARNEGANFYIPTQHEWYKAAFYKGSGTNSGYWKYSTQSDIAPSESAGYGPYGNSANYNQWPGGGVTAVGRNGGPSAYGAYDMSGNASEWNDWDATASVNRVRRGGDWADSLSFYVSSKGSVINLPNFEGVNAGFRLASPVAVPEPSTWVMAAGGLACTACRAFGRRRAGLSPSVNRTTDQNAADESPVVPRS